MGGQFLLQGIFTTQGSNPGLLPCRQILYQLRHQGRLILENVYLFISPLQTLEPTSRRSLQQPCKGRGISGSRSGLSGVQTPRSPHGLHQPLGMAPTFCRMGCWNCECATRDGWSTCL